MTGSMTRLTSSLAELGKLTEPQLDFPAASSRRCCPGIAPATAQGRRCGRKLAGSNNVGTTSRREAGGGRGGRGGAEAGGTSRDSVGT
jgi:hypothetical protein